MSEKIELWECPHCGFAFSADHNDIDPVTGEGNGNHTCPMCELIEKDELIASLQKQLRQANECAARWTCRYNAEETRFQKQNHENARLRSALKAIKECTGIGYEGAWRYAVKLAAEALEEGEPNARQRA